PSSYGQTPAQGSGGGGSTGLIIGLAGLVLVVLLGGLAFALTRPKDETVAPLASTTTTAKPDNKGQSTTTAKGSTSTAKGSSTTDGGDTSTTAKGKSSTTKAASDKTANFPYPKDPAAAIDAAGLPQMDAEGS